MIEKPVAMRLSQKECIFNWREYDSGIVKSAEPLGFTFEYAYAESQLKAERERAIRECAIRGRLAQLENKVVDIEILKLLDN